MSKIIAVVNHKGGVGKTTTVTNLGAALGKIGKKTLIIDLDPQGQTAYLCKIPKNPPPEVTTFDVITGGKNSADAVIKTEYENLSVIAADRGLSEAEAFFASVDSTTPKTLFLSRGLASIKKDFDVILIDCPPTLSTLELNGFAAADELIIPVECEPLCVTSIIDVFETYERIKKAHKKNLKIMGILFTKTEKRVKVGQFVKKMIKEKFPKGLVFETEIPRNIRIKEAQGRNMPVIYYDASSVSAVSYMALAEEIIRRCKK